MFISTYEEYVEAEINDKFIKKIYLFKKSGDLLHACEFMPYWTASFNQLFLLPHEEKELWNKLRLQVMFAKESKGYFYQFIQIKRALENHKVFKIQMDRHAQKGAIRVDNEEVSHGFWILEYNGNLFQNGEDNLSPLKMSEYLTQKNIPYTTEII